MPTLLETPNGVSIQGEAPHHETQDSCFHRRKLACVIHSWRPDGRSSTAPAGLLGAHTVFDHSHFGPPNGRYVLRDYLPHQTQAKILAESKCNRRVTIAQRQQRLTAVLLLLVAVLMVTVVPNYTVMAVLAGYRICSDPRLVPNGFIVFSNYYFPVVFLKFLVNPIIYAWRLQDYRQSMFFYFRESRRPGVNMG